MVRPFWSGQIRISLVSFGVKMFPAVEAKNEIHFHQISRKTGERVRHQKVSAGSAGNDEPVETDDIVKGYEYSKGEYIQIEPQELEQLRIASRHTLEVQQFVDIHELDMALLEKPYFVLPENDMQAEAFGVVRKALQQTAVMGLGKIAVGGRESLIAIGAPADEKLAGMMAYTMRFPAELRSASEYFAGMKTTNIDQEHLSLAEELIKRKTSKFIPEHFKDEYETALRELIDAKLKNLSLPQEQQPVSRGNVIDLMDALRRSVNQPDEKKPAVRATSSEAKKPPQKHGLELMQSASKAAGKRRKSA